MDSDDMDVETAEKLIEALMNRKTEENEGYSLAELQYLLGKLYMDYSAIALESFRRRDEFDPDVREVVDKVYIGMMRMAHAMNEGTEYEEEATENLKTAEELLHAMHMQERGKCPTYYMIDTVFEE